MMTSQPIERLRAALPQLSARDASFASSLIEQFTRKGRLSDQQWPWVEKLANKPNEPKPERVEVGDLAAVTAFFDNARKRLKAPAVVVTVPDVGEVRLSVASSRARVPGSLNVAMNNNRDIWYGRVHTDGTFEPCRKYPTPPTLIPALKSFAADPATVAAQFGKNTGRCCFCDTPLGEGRDKRSVEVGYGPTCAKNFGLPWGVKTRPAAAEAAPLFAEAA